MSSNHPLVLVLVMLLMMLVMVSSGRRVATYLGTSHHSRMILEIVNGPLQMLSTFEAEHLTILVVTPCV